MVAAGTFDSLYNSSTFVKVIQERQGVIVSSPEEIAYKKGYISKTELLKIAKSLSKSNYGQYLMGLVKE